MRVLSIACSSSRYSAASVVSGGGVVELLVLDVEVGVAGNEDLEDAVDGVGADVDGVFGVELQFFFFLVGLISGVLVWPLTLSGDRFQNAVAASAVTIWR